MNDSLRGVRFSFTFFCLSRCNRSCVIEPFHLSSFHFIQHIFIIYMFGNNGRRRRRRQKQPIKITMCLCVRVRESFGCSC